MTKKNTILTRLFFILTRAPRGPFGPTLPSLPCENSNHAKLEKTRKTPDAMVDNVWTVQPVHI
jgi:hypothetical protein